MKSKAIIKGCKFFNNSGGRGSCCHKGNKDYSAKNTNPRIRPKRCIKEFCPFEIKKGVIK